MLQGRVMETDHKLKAVRITSKEYQDVTDEKFGKWHVPSPVHVN